MHLKNSVALDFHSFENVLSSFMSDMHTVPRTCPGKLTAVFVRWC